MIKNSFRQVMTFLNKSEPNFQPPEVTFEIDEIKNYEIFYPNYNFSIIVKDIENPIRFRSLSRLVRRTTRK